MLKRSLGVALSVAVLLTGCTGGTAPSPTTEVTSVSGTPEPGGAAATEATRLVRSGVDGVAGPSVSVPITLEGELEGGTLHVWSVRSTDNSTRLEWAVSHPTLTASLSVLRDYGAQPALVVDGQEYWPSRHEVRSPLSWWRSLVPNTVEVTSDARRSFAMYAPLPEDVTEVEIRTPMVSEPIVVPVLRGAEAVPAGSDRVPIVGQVAYLDTSDPTQTDPLIVTVHGVRRVSGGTMVYLTLVGPEGTQLEDVATWGAGTTLLSSSSYEVVMPLHSTALLDRSSRQAFSLIGTDELRGRDTYSTSWFDAARAVETSPTARVVYGWYPPLPETTTTVDLFVGGGQLIQDLPVEDGPLLPTTAEELPELGVAWPELPEANVTALTPERIATATMRLRDTIVEGAITETGDALDLDSSVLFAYNEATLTPAAGEVIAKAAASVRAAGDSGDVLVTGHTDSDGDDAANLELSRRRAQAVADALGEILGGSYAITVEGKGETDPVALNDSDANKALNRRVTITLP